MGDLQSMGLGNTDQDVLSKIDYETVLKILLPVSHDRDCTQQLSWDEGVKSLVRSLNCDRELVQVRATIKLGRIAKFVPENIIEQTVPHVVTLLSRPSHSQSPSIQETAAFCLGRLARRGDILSSRIGDYGALPVLLRLLQESEGRMQKVVIKALRELVICTQSNQVILARSGGVDTIIHIIASSADDIKNSAAEILSAMTSLKEVRRAIVGLHGIPMLIKSARLGRIASRARAAQAIGLLGVTRRIRRMLVNAGAIPVLIELLREDDLTAKLVSGNALGIISAHVDYLRPVAQAGAIPLFAELLEGNDPHGKEIAEDVFSILAVAEENAIAIAEHLVRILRGSNAEAKAAAADVIWDLSSYKHSISVVRTSGAIPLLLGLLEDENDEVKEKASGAVAQLSYDQGDRGALAEAGAIPMRRFSDFLKLYATIRRTFPKKRIPPAPPKHSFLSNSSRPFLQERRRALEEWMEKLLSDIDISRSVAVASFIELEVAARSAITEINESQESSSGSFTINRFSSSLDLNIVSDVSSVAGHTLVTSGVSQCTADDGSDTVYEASDIGTPRQARDHESEIDTEDTTIEKDLIINGEMKNGISEDEQGSLYIRGSKSLFNNKEIAYADGGTEFKSWHERKISLDSNGSEASSIRGSEISNVGTFTSVTDGLNSFHGGMEHGTDDLSSIDLNFPNDVQAVLPLHERGKMKRVLNILQRQLVTAKTDMEDLIARLNQEVAAKEFLVAKVKDLDGELENYRHKSRETLNQAVLLERERVTQLQWDLEEIRRKVLETEENYKLEQAARVHAEAKMQEAESDRERVQHELSEMSEKLQNFQKDRDNAEAKTKAEMKFLRKELKLLWKSQPELKRELQHTTNAKSELETMLKKERQKQEQATAARAKLLHEAAILRQRLQECSVDIISKGGDKYTVNASSIAEAVDLLRTSDNRIGLLLAEAQLLAQQDEDGTDIADQAIVKQANTGLHGNGNKLRLEGQCDVVGMEAVASEAMVRKMLTDIFIDNAQLRKVVNSVTRSALLEDQKPEKEGEEEAPTRNSVLNKFLEK